MRAGRRLRWGAKILVGFAGAIAAGLVLAALGEPRPLVGKAHDDSPEVEAYARAEAKLFERYGVDGRSRSVELAAPALRVHVIEIAGEGTPIVMLHGGGSTLASWVPLLPELRGRHVFLVDRPGCGQTDGFDYDGVDVRRHAVDFIGGVLDALALERVTLIGNSMGGLWAMVYAKEHPERVEALVLPGCPATFLGTSAPLGMRLATLPGLGPAMLRLGPDDPPSVKKMLARTAGEHAAEVADPALLETARLAQRIPGAKRSFRSLIARVLTLGGARDGGFGDADLATIRTPLLLVWGRHDAFGDAALAERARDAHSTVSARIVEGGHLPWIDDPAHVGEIIRTFLDEKANAASRR
jgi:pimeloyl-ACP methyl ester carboxylesterase